jgi:hypothetical protein
VDLSKFKPGDWLLLAGGAVMLIFGLALDWASAPDELGGGSGNNAFDYFFTGGLAWFLVVGAAVMTGLVLIGAVHTESTTTVSLIAVLATALAALLMLIRLIIGAGDFAGIDLNRAAGMWVAFFAALIAFAGAVMSFTSSGGKLSDLTDIDKVRGAFKGSGRGSTSAPPPPPPASPPPPPPSP